MAFTRNISPYKRTNQPAFEESYKYWLEEELKKIERSVETMQETYNPSYLGSFKDTTTQVASAIDTPTPVVFNTIEYELGVYRGTPTSRIYFEHEGYYNLEFSLQVLRASSASASDVYIWVNYNGSPVPNSATKVHVKGNNEAAFASWNFTGRSFGNDYIELIWSTDSTDTILSAETATAIHPAIPSARMTLTQIAI
jgi:hypothetical protein